RPLPPARQSSKARQEVGKQWIPSCRRTQRPLPPARCLAARSWQHGAARSSPLAIAGAMPSKGGRHRPGVEAIYQDAITRLLTAIMPGEAIEEPCYLLHRICRLMADFVAKVLMVSVNSDSVALMRFAAEAGDDGAAQSRPRGAVLFILS